MSDPPRRGRRPARTAEELRNDMIAAGLELIAERGLSVGLDTVRFDDVISATDVPRASAYRAWATTDDMGPQEHFHERLAASLLSEQPGFGDHDGDGDDEGTLAKTTDAVATVLEQLPDLVAATPEERGHWLRQIHRAGSNVNQQAMDTTTLWRCYIAIAAGLMSQPGVSDKLLGAWTLGEQRLIERYKDLYEAMAALFGLRLRYCYTWEQFNTAAGALAEGITLRTPISTHVSGITRRTGPAGEEQSWTLFAVCFEGLIRQFFEPDPAAPATALDHEDA